MEIGCENRFSYHRSVQAVCDITQHKRSPSLASSILDSCTTTFPLQEIAQGIRRYGKDQTTQKVMSGHTRQIYRDTEQRHVRAGLCRPAHVPPRAAPLRGPPLRHRRRTQGWSCITTCLPTVNMRCICNGSDAHIVSRRTR